MTVAAQCLWALLVFVFAFSQPVAAQLPQEPILRLNTEQHTAPIHAVAVSPDGSLIVTAGDDKTIRVWSSADGEPVDTIRIPIAPGEDGLLYSLGFAPSGRTLLAGGLSGLQWESRNIIYGIRPALGTIGARLPVGGVVKRVVYGTDPAGEPRIGIALSAKQGGAIEIRDRRGSVVFSDFDFENQPEWLEFAPNGDVVVVEVGGRLRVYDGTDFTLRTAALQGDRPAVARPSPNGELVAVGYYDRRAVDIIRLSDFSAVTTLAGRAAGGKPQLNALTWLNADGGAELWAGGGFANPNGDTIVRRWPDIEQGGSYQDIPVADDTITALETTANGEVVFAASDPSWGLIDRDGTIRYSKTRQGADFREVYRRLFAISNDGQKIAFNFGDRSNVGNLIFDAATGKLEKIATTDERDDILETWRQPQPPSGLENWERDEKPVFQGTPLRLALNERSLSADQLGQRFVIGGDRGVYVFDGNRQAVASLALNAAAFGIIGLDNERFIAALGDGTLRWFRFENGNITQTATFFLAKSDLKWLAWLPDGRFFHSSNGGQDLAGYHKNRGVDEAAQWIEFSQLYRAKYAPDEVRRVLLGQDIESDHAVLDTDQITAPRVKVLEFCPEIDGQIGPCAPAELVKRGLSAIDPAMAGQQDAARPIPPEAQAVVLKFHVTAIEGEIAKIDIFQNSRTTGRNTRGLSTVLPAENEDGGVEISRRVRLLEGTNTLQVRVYDQRGVYGQSEEIELFKPPQGEANPPVLHVLAAGTNSYSGDLFTELNFARPDAETVAELVTARQASIYDDVLVEDLYDEEVTRDGVLQAIAAIGERSNPEDSLLIYLGGHGVQTDDGRYRYVTSEIRSQDDLMNKSLDDSTLIEALGAVPARNILLVLDTCYSGSFSESNDASGIITNDTGFMVLSASGSQDLALDGYNDKNGVVGHALRKALEGEASAGPTGLIDAATVGIYVRDWVPFFANEKNYAQQPQFNQLDTKTGVPPGATVEFSRPVPNDVLAPAFYAVSVTFAE